jgi:hypothetical protein
MINIRPIHLCVLVALVPMASSAALTHRWALNETALNPDATGVLESVSSSTVAQVFGTVAGVLGNPGVTAGDLAYKFDGVGNAVSTKSNTVLPTVANFSVFVTAVFATNYQGGGRMLFSNNNSQAGRIDFGVNGTAGTPNQLTFFLGGTVNLSLAFTDSTISPILFDGDFHEVGIRRSSNSFKLYVDGSAVGTSGTSSVAISTSTDYRIGRRVAFSGFYNNLISEVQVFNDARTTGVAIIPEPSAALIGISTLGMALFRRRRAA